MVHYIARTALFATFFMLAKFNLYALEYPFTATVSGKGSPVILIPGYTCGGAVWDSTVAELRTLHQCHVLNIRGFGGVAPAAKDFSLRDVKDGIKAYIKDNKLKNVIVAGHSMGGFLAMWTGAEMKKPELAGVIVVDAVPFISLIGDSTAVEHAIDTASARKMEELMKAQTYEMRKFYGKPMASYYCLDSTYHPLIAEWSAVSDPHTSASLIMEMAATDLRDEIAAIEVPVLVLCAWEPGYNVPMESIRSAWSKQYAAVKNLQFHMVPGSRHFIMYDAPETFYRELNTFMAQTVPGKK
ncbi:MAG: alpha/beta hydrolase [Bacteroidetes bacterium]|nr:alpha/beta hydrolase [Bacteroidota bacterium]